MYNPAPVLCRAGIHAELTKGGTMNPSISGSVRGLVCLLLLTSFASSQNPTAKAARKLSELNTQLLKEVQTATPEVKQAVSQVPAVNPVEVHEIPAPQNPEKTIAVVSESQKRVLLSAVNNFTSAKKKQQTEYSAL